MNRWIVRTALVFVSALAAACGSETPAPSADAEGCEHLQEGPATAVTAAATSDAAPEIDSDHRRYDVTLTAISGGMGGFVRYAASEATDYVFFSSADVPMQFLDATGTAVTPEASAKSSTGCSEIKGRHLVPLEVGPYSIQLGPTTLTSVSIVVEEAAH
jgi:hypothetical protein